MIFSTRRVWLLFTAVSFISLSYGSFCGKSGVPYSFEVLPSGAPVLGCAQPSCVVTDYEAGIADAFVEDSEFLADANGQADGFFRDGDRSQKRYRHPSSPKLIANCSGSFNELSCPRKNQWVGGIEYIDHPRQPLILQCCQFAGLRFSQEVGSTTVGPGEAITGGEVIRNGRQISFDVIANVHKIVSKTGGASSKVSYEVTVRRMNCLPDPPEPEVEFDEDVPNEVFKVLQNANNKDIGTAEKFEKKSTLKNEKRVKIQKQLASPNSPLPEISDSTNEDHIPLPSPNNEVGMGPKGPIQQQPQQIPAGQQPVNLLPVPAPQNTIIPAQPFPQPQFFQTSASSPSPVPQIAVQTSVTPAPFSFPTLPPHTFATLFPAHSFGTFPTHTFPPFPTFAPFGTTASPPASGAPVFPGTFPGFGSVSQSAAAAPIHSAPSNQPQAPPLAFAAPSAGGASVPLLPLPTFQGLGSQQASAAGSSSSLPVASNGAAGAGGSINSQQQATGRTNPPRFGPAGPPVMGTIMQAFEGAYHPITDPLTGMVIGYGNAPSKK